LRTFAHESGHACGLPDLYAYGVVAGFVSEDKVKPLNWSGGELPVGASLQGCDVPVAHAQP